MPSHRLSVVIVALLAGLVGFLIGGCQMTNAPTGGGASAATSPPATSAPSQPTASSSAAPSAPAATAAATASAAAAAQAKPAATTVAPAQTPAAGVAQAKPLAQAAGDQSLRGAVRQVADSRKPAVVLIANLGAGGNNAFGPEPQEQGVGSGVIIDKDGHIVTNNHVVQGAQQLRVVLPDGRTFDGHLVGRDPRTDLAVVKIDGSNLPVAPLASEVNIAVGDWVVAIGNALGLPGGPTVTAGVVGALDRTIQEPNGVALQDMIQTDAAINPGNSGGPLFNLAGEVVGINTAGIEGASGLGFAISVSTVNEIVPQIISNGRVIRPFIGVSVATVTPGLAARLELGRQDGVLVVEVVSGSPAEAAGLQAGDIIIAADGQPIKSEDDLRAFLSGKKVGDQATFTIQRGDKQDQARITLAESPAP
jgi:S1-C subfamily serine protease